jgi:hypothetical protein
MALSVVVGASLEDAVGSERSDALSFARGEWIGRAGQELKPESALVVRRTGADHLQGKVAGCLFTSRRTIYLSDGSRGEVFLLHSLKVHRDLCGYNPGLHLTLLALAISRLAWTEADNDDARALVAVRVRYIDRRVREDLTLLRARRMSPEAVELHGLDEMGDPEVIEPFEEIWEVTPETVRLCARHVQQYLTELPRSSSENLPWCIDRSNGVRQLLNAEIGMRWLRVGSERLGDLATGRDRVDWSQFEFKTMPAEAATRMMECPDGDEPTG